MKKRKTRISGEKARIRQKFQSETGPRCQRAVMSWPLAASTAIEAANVTQKVIAIESRCSRRRIANPPATMIASASASQKPIGPHQNASGSACSGPRSRKQTTRPMLDGLKTWRPPTWIRCFERRAKAAVPAKIHQPCMLHQSPCSVPGTRRMKATPLPVSSALAGHMITCCRRKAIPISSTAQVTQRDEDLGDRELELERDLPEHLQRDDHRGEVEPRIADGRQQDRVGRAADPQSPPGRAGSAHRLMVCREIRLEKSSRQAVRWRAR